MKKIIITLFILIFGLPSFSIERYDETIFDKISVRKYLETILEQESELKQLIKNNPKYNMDNSFECFYNNLLLLVGNEEEYEAKLQTDTLGQSKNFVAIINHTFKNRYIQTIPGRIVYPQTDLFLLIDFPEREGCRAIIDYEYLYNQYSKHLSKSWKQYLKMKYKEQKLLNNEVYVPYYYAPPHKTLLLLYLNKQEFIQNNKDFILKERVIKELDYYEKDFYHNLVYIDWLFPAASGPNGIVDPELIKVYKKFLNKAPRETEGYIFIQKLYKYFKNNNFKYDDTIYIELTKITGNKDYEYFLQLKKQDEELWKNSNI